jgi:integrase
MNIVPARPRIPAATVGDAFDALLARTARRVAGGTRSAATLSMQREQVRYLLERIPAETPIGDVTADRIFEALELEAAGRGGKELSGGTLRKRAYTLSAAIELATGRKPELPEIPYTYEPNRSFLANFDDYVKLRDSFRHAHRLWFVLAVWTGQRHRDVEQMKVEDFDPFEKWVVVRSSKTRKTDGVRIHAAPELVSELASHWALLDPGMKLVPSWSQPNCALRWHCRKLGIPPISTHGLRHTFFTWYVAANGFTPELLEIGGWNDLRIPARVYAHALPPRFQEQIERTVATATSLRRRSRKGSAGLVRRIKNEPEEADTSSGSETRLEGLTAKAGRERRPMLQAHQAALSALVPRVGVEPTAHGFSVPLQALTCESPLSVASPPRPPRLEGLCEPRTRTVLP